MRNTTCPVFRIRALLRACVLLGTAASLLTACINLDRAAIEKRYFNLEAFRPLESGEPLSNTVVRVQRLQVSPRFAGRELVYKTGDSVFESDFYNMYFIPPADMLTQDLREWIQRSKIFSHAVDPASLVNTSCTLEGLVNSLYGDYTKSPPTALVEIQFFLLDDKSPDKIILFSKSYTREMPIEKDSAPEVISGLNRGVKEILTELEADLRKKLSSIEK